MTLKVPPVLVCALLVVPFGVRFSSSQDAPDAARGEHPAAPRPVPSPVPPDEQDPSSTIALKEGLEIRAAHGEFVLRIGGTVQVDGRQIDSGLGDTSTWAIRRADLGFGGAWNDLLEYRLDAEWGSLPAGADVSPRRLSLHSAYVGFNFSPALKLRAGQFKAPFESEYTYTADRYLEFMERSWVHRIIPGRDIGLVVFGDVLGRRADYAVGVFDGSTLESGNKNVTDTNLGKDLMAQVRLRPFAQTRSRWIRRLQLGGGVTWGNSEGDPSPAVSGNDTGLPVVALPSDVVGGRRRSRWAAECYWFGGPFSLKGELARLSADLAGPTAAGRLDATAFFVSATWLITGEEKLHGRIEPKRAFAKEPRGPGAWEIGIRYSGLHDDLVPAPDSPPGFESVAGPAHAVRSWVVGLSWRPHLMGRIMASYAHDALDQPVQPRADGPSAKSGDAFVVRFQVDF